MINEQSSRSGGQRKDPVVVHPLKNCFVQINPAEVSGERWRMSALVSNTPDSGAEPGSVPEVKTRSGPRFRVGPGK